jgi:hypothetical protein
MFDKIWLQIKRLYWNKTADKHFALWMKTGDMKEAARCDYFLNKIERSKAQPIIIDLTQTKE